MDKTLLLLLLATGCDSSDKPDNTDETTTADTPAGDTGDTAVSLTGEAELAYEPGEYGGWYMMHRETLSVAGIHALPDSHAEIRAVSMLLHNLGEGNCASDVPLGVSIWHASGDGVGDIDWGSPLVQLEIAGAGLTDEKPAPELVTVTLETPVPVEGGGYLVVGAHQMETERAEYACVWFFNTSDSSFFEDISAGWMASSDYPPDVRVTVGLPE